MKQAVAASPAPDAATLGKSESPPMENSESRMSASEGSSRTPVQENLRTQVAQNGENTFQILGKLGKLTPEKVSQVSQRYLQQIETTERGEPFIDALAFLVHEEWQKDTIDARDITLELTRALLPHSKIKISHLAFAHQNETPIEFYNEFPVISEICRLLSCPIIQVSNNDFFTVTSINPLTATLAISLITAEIETEGGRRPFSFATTTDLTAWKYTCERHFGT